MSKNRLFVGNMSYGLTEVDLENAFAEFGTVRSVTIVTDRETGRPRGFGFVEMGTDEEARAAVNGLNNRELDGRAINVDIAKPRESRGGFGGGGGGGGGRW